MSSHSRAAKNPLAHRFSQSLTVWEDTDGVFFFIATISLTAGAETYYVMSTWNKLGFKNLITLGLLSGAVCWQNVIVHEWHVLRVESLWQLKYPCFPIKPECQQLPHWGHQCSIIHSSQIFCGTEWSESCMVKQLNWRKWRKIPGNLSET